MASGSTGNYAIPYPIPTDPVNVTGDIEALATRIDNILQEEIEDTAAAMWTSGGTFSNGIQAPTYNDSTGKMSMSLSQDLQASASPTFVNLTLSGDMAVNGGDITTSQTTFNFINTTTTNLNIGEEATSINIGASAGQVNVRGNFNIADTKVYEINDVTVLSASALGSGIVSSSLTSVGTITNGTWDATTIAVNRGGTGITSYTVGDIIYASASSTLEKLASVAVGNVLISGGINTAPSWGKVGLTTHVSGTLGVANGGTGVTSSTGSASVVLSDSPTLTGIPVAPTASVDTDTTQIATTAFVIGQEYLKSSTASATYSPINNPTFTGTISSEGTEIKLNVDATSGTEDVFFTVERGSDPDVSIRWNEIGDTWQFTNDGTNYIDIGSGGSGGVGLESVLFLAGM